MGESIRFDLIQSRVQLERKAHCHTSLFLIVTFRKYQVGLCVVCMVVVVVDDYDMLRDMKG